MEGNIKEWEGKHKASVSLLKRNLNRERMEEERVCAEKFAEEKHLPV